MNFKPSVRHFVSVTLLLLLTSPEVTECMRHQPGSEAFPISVDDESDCAGFDGVLRVVEEGRWEALLPPAGRSNHASFIEEAGEMVMSWFAGSREGRSGVGIYVSRLQKQGPDSVWTKPELVSIRDKFSNQNPVLYFDLVSCTLHLFHTQQEELQPGKSPMDMEETATLWHLESADGGKTWSEPRLFIDEPRGMFIRNRIIMDPTSSDTLLLPLYHVPGPSSTQFSTLVALEQQTMIPLGEFVIWDSFYLVQASVVPMGGSRLLAFFRDRRSESIYISESADSGRIWAKPRKTPLVNNNSGIHAFTLNQEDGNNTIVIVFNNCRSGRVPLSIALSDDEGHTWPHIADLESTEAENSEADQHDSHHGVCEVPRASEQGMENGPEYSYPTVMQSSDGNIHVSYTWLRKTIKHVVVTEQWIRGSRHSAGCYNPNEQYNALLAAVKPGSSFS
mmetsp:Transcript_27784/g.71510  ORF Transcript_27784/g.71510 Transcript_27784/m.71510 type:complete len:448 (+) Transcript_27784:69-1412(+)